jgi:hypothetical protein
MGATVPEQTATFVCVKLAIVFIFAYLEYRARRQ